MSRLRGWKRVPLLALLALPVLAADRWTEFRGPAGTGHSDASSLPREWSETANVAWKTKVHGRGWSSPVVLGSQVWLTTATRDGRGLSVLALHRDSGKVLHDVLLFEVEKPEDTARYNSFASPSGPAATCRATTGVARARRRSSTATG
jgi:hypothetical protein